MAAALERGEAPPPGTEYRLWDIGQPYFQSWSRLHGARPWAGGADGLMFPMGLVYTELREYARDHGYADTLADLDEFIEVMWSLDEVYLKWWRAQNERKR